MTPAFPQAFETRMRERLGSEWPDFERTHMDEPPVSIRFNPLKGLINDTGLQRIPWAKDGVYLKERPSFTLDPLFHAGCYYVQEASSMFLEQAIRQYILDQKQIRVLDLCAAPGGKSTHLLSLLDTESLLVSNEVIRSRVNILSENIQKWGYPNVVVSNNDPKDFTSLTGFFDAIVVDAPCSGEGLFRKDPHAMREWSEDNVLLCSQRQQRIVEDVWPALKEDGFLIYSTCTYSEQEDENILRWIDESFEAAFCRLTTNGLNIEEIEKSGTIGYRLYPHRVRGEGFFISVIQKKSNESPVAIKAAKSGFALPEKKNVSTIKPWLTDAADRFIQREDLIQLLPEVHADAIYFLTQRLRVNYAGTFIASVKQNKLVPDHPLALSTRLNTEAFLRIDLDEKNALRYLRKDPIDISSDQRGFALATFRNTPLGWMNLIPGRINNLYPAEWRIRMQI